MKSKFSTSWVSSKQPRKQRKYRANAPLHLKHRFLNANLSKTLRSKYGKRSLPLRKGDEVLVMRGAFKKKKAKVVSISLQDSFVTLEGLQRSKKDGTKIAVKFSPSNLQITELTLEDKKRFSSLKTQENKSEKKNEKTEVESKKTEPKKENKSEKVEKQNAPKKK